MAIETIKEKIPIVIDYREKKPYSFDYNVFDYQDAKRLLSTGDYSIKGFETNVAIERKSVNDFVQTISNTARRKRFFEEIDRLASMEMHAIVVEGTVEDIVCEATLLRCMSAESMTGFVVHLSTRKDLNFILAGSRPWANTIAEKVLIKFWKNKKAALRLADKESTKKS